jgi:hypothetical protein
MPIDPEIGIPELVHRLNDDAKRLMSDEVRLTKLEVSESVTRAGKGAMWLGISFGIGVVALIAATLLLITLIGRWDAGHMWLGAIVVGVVELILAGVMIKRGISAFGGPSYSFEQTRKALTS